MKQKPFKSVKGATMTEYVLIIGLIAAGAVLALTSVGTGISGFFTNMVSLISSAGSNF